MARKTKDPRKPLLGVREAAALMSMSEATAYRSIDKGDFPVPWYKINGTIKIPRWRLENFLYGGEGLAG
ncbi:MAG: helix-turn-helix domain-containing protein [Actinomycetota bacterium]|nr:helix-turn-helix domain-containing protein [Actinomycetota bacterium]